jgi:hypothetical protein
MMAGTEDVKPPPPTPDAKVPAGGRIAGAPPSPSGAPPAPAGAHKGPLGAVGIGTPISNLGTVPNAERALAGMRAGFRYCYDRGLAVDPSMHGHLKITMKLAPTGEVKEVTLTPANELSPPVRACVAARAQAGKFEPPKGGATALSVPVVFGKE